ncbi:DeoR/GlpR family DNA-binding transcription regulator [Sanguibacter antarcticus]|uniref:Lactose phosphotransferase system repressor n=1 Tax=Sanguibacter antarcticus TaxID=372484 RepID=A0A2A9E8J1_9MICO|nr:DeoR/GlpR family DNA-binding transcription regulator [Sanguibacter antarcticus]PFG34966.1 DeoR family transcriptional regulator [Sanguibacter antarcticus]
MYAEERQQAIAELVQARGRASVNELAKDFAVTTETVRRDLSVLEVARIVRRVHGGAVRAASVVVTERGLDERDATQAREKERIARAALGLLPADGGSVLIDAGSSTGRFADLLPLDTRLAAFTHGVPIASRLAALPGVELHLLPGRVRTTTQAAVGSETVQAVENLRVDVAFLGANGISVEHGFSTPDPEEAAVKRAIVRAARRVVVLADSTKFGLDATVSFALLEDVDVVVTDAVTADLPLNVLRDAGIEVVIV